MLREYLYRTQVFFRQLFSQGHLTKAQIVEDVLASLTEADRVLLKYTPEDRLISYHLTFGMYIRNTYKLWHPDYPYLDGAHPDDFSFEIIKEVWKRLRAN